MPSALEGFLMLANAELPYQYHGDREIQLTIIVDLGLALMTIL